LRERWDVTLIQSGRMGNTGVEIKDWNEWSGQSHWPTINPNYGFGRGSRGSDGV